MGNSRIFLKNPKIQAIASLTFSMVLIRFLNRKGLMNNPNIPYSDLCQIGYSYIDNIPENMNGTVNTKQQSFSTYLQGQEPGFELASGSGPEFFWDGQYTRMQGGTVQDLVNLQINRHIDSEIPNTCDPEERSAPSIQYQPGIPVNTEEQ